MRVKNYGLLFDYLPSRETLDTDMPITNQYVTQEFTNFVLVNYYKGERKNVAFNSDGFQSVSKQMYIELYALDTNPRKILFDKKDDKFYKILETPINQEFEPNKRKLYTLPIELINDSNIKFDKAFIVDKFNELWEVLNGSV